ncbi:MAG: MaoC family dehydratase [Burkholderiales bacterium]|nr:MaoC family dehydratase [Burkholderiales bacterium]MDE1926437.1 MaoC family dehydratase [Burkholderiales bacterium]MDE2160567.1 MaoC family dehydratase [Burkholderiales bacterium]MDE2503816.1 MaoC family dehydratase [Burkholderiales bacterium]
MQPTPSFEGIALGDELPPLSLPITVALVAGGAIATRDYFPGHHDLEAARALGSPHIFMNILTTNGLVQRYVEQWAGPAARLASLKIKLGAPNYPGDVMRLSGSVSDKREADRSVEITLKGANSMGSHVSGTVRVRWA